MSNIKARLMKPTGLEFHETAFEIDREIWSFIKHEYKNKGKDGAGNLPVRYMKAPPPPPTPPTPAPPTLSRGNLPGRSTAGMWIWCGGR